MRRRKINYEALLHEVEGLISWEFSFDWLMGQMVEFADNEKVRITDFDTDEGIDFSALAWYLLNTTIDDLKDSHMIDLTDLLPDDSSSKDALWNLYDNAREAFSASGIEHQEARTILLDIGCPIVFIWGERN